MTGNPAPFFDFGRTAPIAGEATREFLAARKLAFSVERVLRLSRAFAEAGRPLDLNGINLLIGRLTASIFDLDLREARRLLPDLQSLLDALNTLERTLIALAPGSAGFF
jgi:hypothetical protein